jgi:hypothetical protein
MNQNKNHWIALYLGGQYPSNYRIPSKLGFLARVRKLDFVNFGEATISLVQNKSDVEFFYNILDTFEDLNGESAYQDLITLLNVPDTVYKTSVIIDSDAIVEKLKEFNETEFSRQVVTPLLLEMGYKDIVYKGKVNQNDHGLDYYIMSFESPSNHIMYSGVQVKAVKIKSGSTTGSELEKLKGEVRRAFSNNNDSQNGNQVTIDELLIFNSKEIPESTLDEMWKDQDLCKYKSKIRIWDCEGVLGLIQKYKIVI